MYNNTMSQNQNIVSRQPYSVAVARLPGNFSVPLSYNIAYSYRTDKPDPLMVNTPQSIENLRTSDQDEYIRQIVKLINYSSKNDFERVKKAHDLIALVLNYDDESYRAKRIPDQGYQCVLKTGLSVCAGYANVFKKFCDELGIPCIVVSGYARGVGTSPTDADKPNESNHAWNIVTIYGANFIIDCTWDSSVIEGRVSKRRYSTDYLFIKPKHLIYSHFPKDVNHQLLTSPLSAAQFGVLPPLKPKFFYIIDNPSVDLKKRMHVDNKTTFEYTVKDGYYLSYNIKEMKSGVETELKNRVFVQRKGSRHTVHFSFPSAGQYKVNIFCWETSADTGEGCGEFIFVTISGSRIEFPTIFSADVENLEIHSPIEMPLKKGRAYTFRVKVDNKSNVAIIHGKTFIELTKRSNGVFSKNFIIPKDINELSLGIADIGTDRYKIIAEYRVD
jgi:hypothetical protein